MVADTLTNHGFVYAGSCRCGGYLTAKYRKGQYQIKWRKTKYQFKVMHDNATLYTWKSITELENTLNELAKKNIQPQAKI